MKTYTIPDRRPEASRPWDDEPDKAVWIDPDTELDCMIVRNSNGALCGYVGVPPGHPWHGRNPFKIEANVHGGVTYGALCDEEAGICHTPQPGRPDHVWWLGFDCAHMNDRVPIMEETDAQIGIPIAKLLENQTYRDFAYVQDQVRQLAAQAAEAA